MARFNTAATTNTKTTNLAGGQAYTQNPELALVSLLLTSFANDQYYRKADDSFAELRMLIAQCDKKFVAQAAIYTRTKFGMRSISHVAASELAKHISGQPWAKKFYDAIVYRPDDMTEIAAYHLAKNGKITNAIKRGFAAAFGKFDAYQLAKYRGTGQAVNLVDVANMVHPKPVTDNKDALTALMKGELKSVDTWEAKLTKAGQVAESEDEKSDLKADAWATLINSGRIGYFALLKNLRNIITQAPDVVPKALELLTDEQLIKKSLVLPFRFTTAYAEIEKMTAGKLVRDALVALNKALDISVSNVPKFDGTTLVVLDVSGSMAGKPAQIGGLFAAVLVKANNCDFMTFDEVARYQNLNPNDSTITLSKGIRFTGGGTDFHAIFKAINQKYDRIIILSDMQAWMGGGAPTQSVNAYKSKHNADPFIYSFDLQGYGSLQFPENRVFALAGFSDKVFDLMRLLETDKKAMVNEIKKIEF